LLIFDLTRRWNRIAAPRTDSPIKEKGSTIRNRRRFVPNTTDRLASALAGRYTTERELGQGGMATVYLAEDLKHHRKVALKVLKPDLAAVLGAQRFVQEITTTAQLQHPHILPLFDSGEADGFLYYVMPYIEGETLRDKLNRETQLGIEEAIKITTEVADGLDYAHRNSVIHRDIKPENILLHDGRPMVADFGIALAVSAAAGGRMTETGLSLGTPHYMSPEQATAEKDITHRSDIYSLGSVLYEMLTGEPPHTGGSAQAIIMKIVTEEAAPVTKVRRSVPPNVAAAVSKALEKLAADRFGAAKEFADALTNPAFTLPTTQVATVVGAPASGPWKRVAIATTALAAVFVLTTLGGWLRPEPAKPVSRYGMTLPNALFEATNLPRLALSPDGARLVYVGSDDGMTDQLLMRTRDELTAVPLPGTEDARAPFFSPDGSQVGFLIPPGVLKVVSLAGGPPTTVRDSRLDFRGASWGAHDLLYVDGEDAGVMRVSSDRRVTEPVTVLDTAHGETNHLWPEALPNGKGILVTVAHGSSLAEMDIAVVDFATGTSVTTRFLSAIDLHFRDRGQRNSE
jgi:serine/threonine-protein kinase